MRGEKRTYGPASLSTQAVTYDLPVENDGICEIDLGVDFQNAETINIQLSNEAGERVTMVYDLRLAGGRRPTFSMHRQRSGDTSFSEHFPVTTTAPLLFNDKSVRLRIYIDRCSIEAFDGQGRFAMTNLVFPTTPYTQLSVSARGGKARTDRVIIYPLVVE